MEDADDGEEDRDDNNADKAAEYDYAADDDGADGDDDDDGFTVNGFHFVFLHFLGCQDHLLFDVVIK